MQSLSLTVLRRNSLSTKRMLSRPRHSKMILQISLIRCKKFANTYYLILRSRLSFGLILLTLILRTLSLNPSRRYQGSGADTSSKTLSNPISKNTTKSSTILPKRRTENSPRSLWEAALQPSLLVTLISIISSNYSLKLTLRSISTFSSSNSNLNSLKQLVRLENFVKVIPSDNQYFHSDSN